MQQEEDAQCFQNVDPRFGRLNIDIRILSQHVPAHAHPAQQFHNPAFHGSADIAHCVPSAISCKNNDPLQGFYPKRRKASMQIAAEFKK